MHLKESLKITKMNYLYRISENFISGSPDTLVIITSLLAIISGILVIVSKNPIVSVLFLIGLFLSIASYLMTVGVSFIGLSYLLVYVGAVSILFLFILMLINVRVSELVTDNNNSIPLSIIIIIIFSSTFYNKIPSSYSVDVFNFNLLTTSVEKNSISFVTSHSWDATLSEISHISSIGNILYTSYPMLLMVTSIILLLAMVGTIVITVKQK